MKLFTFITTLCVSMAFTPSSARVAGVAAMPDSVYLFAYATDGDDGRSGLRFAWSCDSEDWFCVGEGRSFLKCDYANWGGEKRMVKPRLGRTADKHKSCCAEKAQFWR